MKSGENSSRIKPDAARLALAAHHEGALAATGEVASEVDLDFAGRCL